MKSNRGRWAGSLVGVAGLVGWGASGQDVPATGPTKVAAVAVGDPEPSLKNVASKKEHCGVAPALLAEIGSARGRQVRVQRGEGDFAIYTVAEVLDKGPGDAVAISKLGRGRIGPQSDPFAGKLSAHLPHSELTDDEAKARGELVERLTDDGANTGLLVMAPHGGQLEPPTDQQALRVAEKVGKRVTTWRCLGFHPRGGGAAFARWHITSTDISEASYPLLGRLGRRRFAYAVSFHGMVEDRVLVGGSGPMALKVEVRDAIRTALAGTTVQVDVALPGDANGGKDPQNIVNRYVEGGGIQVEQSSRARREHWQAIADAVAGVFAPKL